MAMARPVIIVRCWLVVAVWLFTLSAELAAQPEELSIGSPLPLQDHQVTLAQDGSATTVGALSGSRGTVIIFWSNSCEWTMGYVDRVEALYEMGASVDVSVYLVNSNDVSAFPAESVAASAEAGHTVPYVSDPHAVFAAALGAVRAPHVFAFDANRLLVYSGAIDDAPADASDVQEFHLQSVVAALGAGQPSRVHSTRAFGCRIRYPGG